MLWVIAWSHFRILSDSDVRKISVISWWLSFTSHMQNCNPHFNMWAATPTHRVLCLSKRIHNQWLPPWHGKTRWKTRFTKYSLIPFDKAALIHTSGANEINLLEVSGYCTISTAGSWFRNFLGAEMADKFYFDFKANIQNTLFFSFNVTRYVNLQ